VPGVRPLRGGARRALAASLALALAAGAAYAPVVDNGFLAYDDPATVSRNSHVARGLDAESLRWALTSTATGNWIPVTRLARLGITTVLGPGPAAHHLAGAAGHAAGAVTLFLALSALAGGTLRPALAAGIFALHPLGVESVAWATELSNVLGALFLALTLLAYARYARRPGPGRGAVVAGLFALGLLAKPTLAPLPVLLLLLDLWPLGRHRRAGPRPRTAALLLAEKLPLLLLAVAAGAVALATQLGEGSLHNPVARLPIGDRLANALVSAAAYLRRMLWPSGLAAHYPHPGAGLPAALVAGAAALLVLATALSLARWRRNPWLALGWLWLLAFLLPVSGLVQVGLQGMADRYAYLPLGGASVAAAWSVGGLARARRGAGMVIGAAAIAALLALGVATRAQCRHWRTTESLFRHSLAVTGPNPYALTALGVGLNEQGRHGEAIGVLGASLALMPDYAFTHYVLGNALVAAGRRGEAIARYREAVQLVPRAVEARNNLGATLAEVGRPREAEEQFREALRIAPDYAPAAANLRALGSGGVGAAAP